MTHARPIPDAATPPYPPHPAPRADQHEGDAPAAAETAKPKRDSNWAAAVGIGSAAIVAALIYTNWPKSGSRKK